jgi:mono/diheme cytochrome c family protein
LEIPLVARFSSQETAVNTPVTEMVVNSLITSHVDGAMMKVGAPVTVAGIAWDGGYGMGSVEVSVDGEKIWATAILGEDLGPFVVRSWSLRFSPNAPGKHVVMARSTNKIGPDSQSPRLSPQPRPSLDACRSMRRGTMRSIAIAAIATTLVAGSAAAEEKPVQLKQAPGLDKIESNCGGCHSLDYVLMNSPFLSAPAWEGESPG